MSQKSKKIERARKREQKKSSQKLKNIKNRAEFYNKLFKICDINDSISNIPYNIRQYIYTVSWPQININYDQIKDHPELEIILNKINHNFNNSYVEINNNQLKTSEVYGILGIYDAVKSIHANAALGISKISPQKHSIPVVSVGEKKEKTYRSVLENSGEAKNKLSNILDNIGIDYVQKIGIGATREILAYYSFDKIGLYPVVKLCETEGKKTYVSIDINTIKPIEENFAIDNKNRKIYKCFNFDYNKLNECEFPVDIIENKIPLPIYIQDHAINRLVERVTLNPLGYIFDNVARSLINPVVSKRDKNSYLIDFYYFKNKLGYLVVSVHKNIAVIRTFKFITMSGTPEFNKLRKELRGSREEFEYWGLDSLDIINSDLCKDEKIREIFEKCDLGHLLKISESIGNYEKPKFEIANEIRKHFKL